MIRLNHSLTVFVILALLVSCNKSIVYPREEQTESSSSVNPHAIPVEYAVASLYSFLGYDDDKTTKSNLPQVESVSTIRMKDLRTKSVVLSSESNCDELVYLVNFTNENGYAILAADDRITEGIITVVEEGSLSSEDLFSDYEKSHGRVIDFNYPTEGSGILYSDEYPDDIFINPNTFTLFDEDNNDCYVGDYYYEGAGNSVSTPQQIINNMSLEYAINEISSHDLLIPIDDEEPGGGTTTSVITSTQTVITSSVAPMLTVEKYWKQTSPFNDYCPTVRKYIVFGQSRTGYAGCVPLAVSKIMAHFEWPTSITYNGIPVCWTELKSNYNSLVGKQSAAALLRLIGLECNSLYFYEGTFTFPNDAKNFLADMLFPNVNLVDYSTSSVVSMLDNGCPVFICSVPHNGGLDYDLASSHGWNIDGYKIKQTTTTRKYYVNGVYSHTTTTTSSPSTMVHCDFGWQGSCNGYYASGIFKLNGSGVEYDNPSDTGDSTNYNDYLKIITYNRPY